MKDRFEAILQSLKTDKKRLNQHIPEWLTYLNIARGYLAAHGVDHPVVVEIGILDGAQRRFYEELLGATYIGIDIDRNAPADIRGDSASPETRDKLAAMLGGRPIDLLFIDGLHTYAGVKADFEMYYPMTRYIVALHDILTPKNCPEDTVDVIPFWEEIKETNTTDTILTVQHHNPRPANVFNGRPLGIGMLLKQMDPVWVHEDMKQMIAQVDAGIKEMNAMFKSIDRGIKEIDELLSELSCRDNGEKA